MRWLRVLYLSNGLAVGSLYGFIPVLLQAKGFDPALIGLTTGLGSLAYTFALPIWGHVGDMVSGPRRALQMACIPAAIFAIGLGAPLPVLAIIACQILMSAGAGPAAALTDAMALPALKNASTEYARLRLLASVGAAGGGIACGFVYAAYGYMVAPALYGAVMILTVVSAQFVPLGRDSERQRRRRASSAGRVHTAPVHGRFGSVGEAFKARPRLFAVLVSVTLVFMGIMAGATYISLRISDLGGGAVEVGMANGIGSSAEIPGLILAGWLIARFGARRVMAVSSFGYAVTMLSWIVLVDAGPILLTRFIAGIFFSGLVVAFTLTIAKMLPAGLQSTGQTLLQAACYGVAAILANFFGGLLYQNAGPLGVFGGGAICAVIGGLVGLAALPAAGRVAPEPPIAPTLSPIG
jgi:MFS family permease